MAIDSLGVLTRAHAPTRRPAAHHEDPGDMGGLERALMRRSLAGLADQIERCGRCARTLLIGERVYEYAAGAVRCELCRSRERATPEQSHTVHGPEFGHTIRVVDQRPGRAGARRPAVSGGAHGGPAGG